MPIALYCAGFLLLVFLAGVATSLRVIPENERVVVYMLGRYAGVKGPGIILVAPVVQNFVRVDMRVRKLEVSERLSAADNTVSVAATVMYRVTAPDKAVNNVVDFARAFEDGAKASLKEACAGGDISSRIDKVANDAKQKLAAKAEPWGITVSSLDVRYPA